MNVEFDEKDQVIADQKIVEREKISGPRIGDFVRFPAGEIERISHDWGDSVQTSPVGAGSFYLSYEGNASFSGGLNPSIPKDSLRETDEIRKATFWFFHHDWAGADRGVRFEAPCRVFETTAPYEGFMSYHKEWKCDE